MCFLCILNPYINLLLTLLHTEYQNVRMSASRQKCGKDSRLKTRDLKTSISCLLFVSLIRIAMISISTTLQFAFSMRFIQFRVWSLEFRASSRTWMIQIFTNTIYTILIRVYVQSVIRHTHL